MSRNFFNYFRCPADAIQFAVQPGWSEQSGYFRFGRGVTCYGNPSTVPTAKKAGDELSDALPEVRITAEGVDLPFDPDRATDALRFERYPLERGYDSMRIGASPLVRDVYYVFRPLMPVPVRSVLQRAHLRGQLSNHFPNWPVDRTVDRILETLMEFALRANGNEPIPFVWFWPEGKRAALILTHDVESSAGIAFTPRLMDIDAEFGFRSSFQLIPEKRYEVTSALLHEIKSRGFEVNVHDLNHDGNLFREHEEFKRRAAKINSYAIRFGSRGFRSGALYRRLDWYHALNISYDMSVPNVAHLDPQNGGCCTILPYFIGDILELPVTETQDYSLFHILKQYSINLWKQQTQILIRGNGIISFITHPDYLIAPEARNVYRQLLAYLANTCCIENLWAALPAEIDRWWRLRSKMRPVLIGNTWQIQGPGCERARIAYARIVDGKLQYTIPPSSDSLHPIYVTTPALPQPNLALSATHSLRTSDEHLSSTTAGLHTAVEPHDHLHDPAVPPFRPEGAPPESQLGPQTMNTSMETLEQQSATLEASQLALKQQTGGKTLRVCMVAYTFYEADNRVMRYAETLVQSGHHVDVFALKHGENTSDEVICGVQVRRLQSRVINEKNRFSYAWRIWFFLLRAFYHVCKEDLREKYDLIHVHSVPDFLVFSALLPRLRGTPVILDIHDILPEFYLGKFGGHEKSWIFRCLTYGEKLCANFASHVIIANDIWRERLIGRSVAPSRCTVVLNFPDRSIFHPSQEPPHKNGRFLLLYPGTLNFHQGLDIAVRAFAKISQQVPEADFHIYGEGPARPILADMIQELGLEGRVFLKDSRRIREIAGIMEQADLGIVPKRKDNFGNEAFSTKIFEFMAMRVPVIVSDTRIDRYYFNDSLVKFFQGGDVDDLARSMLEMIRSPEKRRALVENACEFIDRNDWAVKKREYLDLVDRLTGSESQSHAAVGVQI